MLLRIQHIASALFLLSQSQSVTAAATKTHYLNHAVNATDILVQEWYDSDTGRFDNYWWQTASIISTLADLATVDESAFEYADWYFRQTFTNAPSTNNNTWNNEYYDDEGWWALAWIKIYDMTKQHKYLDAAQSLFDDMVTGLGSDCGGQWWSKDKTYTATISNQLFFATAAALANRVELQRSEYASYASGSLNWLKSSGLLTSNGTFLDGRDAEQDCKLIGPAWTYNQGVILGGLVEYYALINDKALLDLAHKVAHGTIEHLTDDNGILTEDGYPEPLNEDRAIFKGIFARNLAYLHQASPDEEYVSFILKNADMVWTRGRAKNGLIGPNWQGPLRAAFVTTQASAVDLFVAAAAVAS